MIHLHSHKHQICLFLSTTWIPKASTGVPSILLLAVKKLLVCLRFCFQIDYSVFKGHLVLHQRIWFSSRWSTGVLAVLNIFYWLDCAKYSKSIFKQITLLLIHGYYRELDIMSKEEQGESFLWYLNIVEIGKLYSWVLRPAF